MNEFNPQERETWPWVYPHPVAYPAGAWAELPHGIAPDQSRPSAFHQWKHGRLSRLPCPEGQQWCPASGRFVTSNAEADATLFAWMLEHGLCRSPDTTAKQGPHGAAG